MQVNSYTTFITHSAKYVFIRLLFNPFYSYAKNVIVCSRHLVSRSEQEKKVDIITINWCTPTVNKVKNDIGKYLNFFCSPYWTDKYHWNWNVLHESQSHYAGVQDRAILISHPKSRKQVETKFWSEDREWRKFMVGSGQYS